MSESPLGGLVRWREVLLQLLGAEVAQVQVGIHWLLQ